MPQASPRLRAPQASGHRPRVNTRAQALCPGWRDRKTPPSAQLGRPRCPLAGPLRPTRPGHRPSSSAVGTSGGPWGRRGAQAGPSGCAPPAGRQTPRVDPGARVPPRPQMLPLFPPLYTRARRCPTPRPLPVGASRGEMPHTPLPPAGSPGSRSGQSSASSAGRCHHDPFCLRPRGTHTPTCIEAQSPAFPGPAAPLTHVQRRRAVLPHSLNHAGILWPPRDIYIF